MSLLYASHEATNLVNVMKNIESANNGYVFASSLCPSYLRRTEQLVQRGCVVKGRLKNSFGVVEDVFFTKKSAEIYNHLLNRL
jgi:hypothetical protein